MKKILLKKTTDAAKPVVKGYKLNYERDLNKAQYDAVMHNNGAALVIAGAGTGKTRTLIYRVSRLVEDGVPPESILLLTFTRKASAEMLRRAGIMLDGRCERVSGGTFHSFSLGVMRRHASLLGYDQNFTMLDGGDSEDTINLLRSQMKFDKTKKRFPRKETLSQIFNLTINRCQQVEDVIINDYAYFIDNIDEVKLLFDEYNRYKRRYNLMDYDDLLLNLLLLCRNVPDVKKELNLKYKYIMVDEYQDTNKLQHEIVLQLAGKHENVMAVGDDAQSIYSFRGAEFQNIMTFPNSFEKCEVYKIEENYRSTQPLLDLSNKIIEAAVFKYRKELYSMQSAGELPKIISSSNERQQSMFIAQQLLELREEGIPLEDMAVLFRSGFLSFDLEIELSKANIPYRKFGGMKFIETGHIKDLLAFFKILHNPKDAVSWHRLLMLHEGVGPRTSAKTVDMITNGEISLSGQSNLDYIPRGQDEIKKLFGFLKEIEKSIAGTGDKASLISEYYRPIMKSHYDDWLKRWKDIEMFVTIAERYKNINDFLSDMVIEPPVESVVDIEQESNEEEYVTLSTVHSAKGLEWKAVFLIWALDGRFPTSKSADILESLEEERRLFYVACTRAKTHLYITYPTNIFDREQGIVLSKPSRFIGDITENIAERFMLEEWSPDEN